MPCFSPFSYSSCLKHQSGAAGITFFATAIPLLLLALGATETGRWYTHRYNLDLALLEANRAGISNYANPKNMENTFIQSLEPLYISGDHNNTQDYFKHVEESTHQVAWQITIQSPTLNAFKDFNNKDLEVARKTGLPTIDNNYQEEQNQKKGNGMSSSQSIFEANILSLDLVYPYKPLIPGMGSLFKLIGQFSDDPLKKAYYSAGYLPIHLSSEQGMQTHPVQWPNLANRRIIWAGTQSIEKYPITATKNCTNGIWCNPRSDKANQYNVLLPSPNKDKIGTAESPHKTQSDRLDLPSSKPSGTMEHSSDSSSKSNHSLPTQPDTSSHDDLAKNLQSNHHQCGEGVCCGEKNTG